MEQSTLQVQGMSCGHCVKAVEGNVGELAGVESKVHLDKGQVEVSFHPDQITLHQISDVIEEQGYDVV
ncbi:copper chaperone CopZ [Bacillus altitudinis]|uniref:copper chaperone CopZ n=1 Tax=Bacillus altitudinis TaxID=293387 RepID=UPI0005D337EC|nr:copper chaperone CopZ [Bacillus altitudinis]KJF49466.1 copper resistance protein CopZ [Bacillus altitudinis]